MIRILDRDTPARVIDDVVQAIQPSDRDLIETWFLTHFPIYQGATINAMIHCAIAADIFRDARIKAQHTYGWTVLDLVPFPGPLAWDYFHAAYMAATIVDQGRSARRAVVQKILERVAADRQAFV